MLTTFLYHISVEIEISFRANNVLFYNIKTFENPVFSEAVF